MRRNWTSPASSPLSWPEAERSRGSPPPSSQSRRESDAEVAFRRVGTGSRIVAGHALVNSNSVISGRAPSRIGKPVVPMPRFM
jgi:hypothetical protein